MKLILLKDVKSLGKKGDVVEVNEGYGRNFIIPSKAGILADAKNLNSLKLQKKKEEKLAAEKLAAGPQGETRGGEDRPENEGRKGGQDLRGDFHEGDRGGPEGADRHRGR